MVAQGMKVKLIHLTHFVDGAVNDPRAYHPNQAGSQ
jgi:hypothetical protein